MERSNVFLGDYVSVGAFTKVFPVKEVKRILKETNLSSKRERSLPNHLIVYYVMAMTLLMTAGYKEVLRWLLEGMRHARGMGARVKPLCTSGITQARQRLGHLPFKRLFEALVRPVAEKNTKGAWYKEWLLVSIDGSYVDIADTEENIKEFGRPKCQRGRAAFPKLRFVGLVELGTKVLFSVAAGGYHIYSERDLARKIMGDLNSGMLCIADRYYYGFYSWKLAVANGADLLWRARTGLIFAIEKSLPDGSYLSAMYPSERDKKYRTNGVRVRIIEYKINGLKSEDSFYRLVTTILDPTQAPANELAALYHERWEFENALDELKTHLKGYKVVLRSKTAELVKQEFYGLLLSYYTIRTIMHEAALEEDIDPDRLSFIHSVRVIRRAVPMFGIFSPAALV